MLARRDEAMDRGQAERLLPMLEELLAEAGVGWAALDGIGGLHRARQLHRAARSRWRRRAGWRWRSASRRSGVTRFEALADRPGAVTGDARRQARPLRPGASATASPLGAARRPAALGRAPVAAVGAPRADPRGARARSPRGGSGRAPPPAPLYLRPADARRRPSRRRRSSMTPEALAALHALAFADTPRPWTAAEFAALLARARRPSLAAGAEGFALGRVAGPEAELLTLAVHPRRGGAGSAARWSPPSRRRPRRAAPGGLLEVAETNAPARALYAGSATPRPAGGRATTPRGRAAGRRAGAAQAPRSPLAGKTI